MEDAGARNGCYLNGQRVDRGLVGETDIVELGHVFLTLRTLVQPRSLDVGRLEATDLARLPPGFRTLLPPLAARLEDLRRVARSTIGVLLIGETGTGKEVLARAIHEVSARTGPLVPVNCNTLTEGLAESQLFGHVKGAFSGAIGDSPGFVRAADHGTLLLDEVGDLGATAQGAMLRVLQEREVVPVGRAHAHKVDVRFIGTSPRPLTSGDAFRSDLFARLSGFVHEMTPLRDRREDLGLLIAGLLRKVGARDSDRPQIAPDMGLGLLTHRWPLNVRELEQLLNRTWLLAEGGLMSGPPRFLAAGAASATPREALARPPRVLSPDEQETQQQLADALAAARGNVTEAARALGKGRVQFHRLMKRFGVDARRFRG
jgi:transcriptional regulator with GAF, ATPase, and Fis domain